MVNPFDRFGDHLRLALHAPASYQLLTWLESGPGAELPVRGRPPTDGRWIMCGYGRFGRKLVGDLRTEGLEVTVIEPKGTTGAGVAGPGTRARSSATPRCRAVMARADLQHAVGFVAGTDNDTTNLSLVAAARRLNPDLFVAARQNRPASAPLFATMEVDALLVPTEVVAHEVYAQLSTPLLWRFLHEMPARDDEWAAGVIDRLSALCGRRLQALWKVRLTPAEAPAVQAWLASGAARLGDLMRESGRPGRAAARRPAARAAGRRVHPRARRRLRAGARRRDPARRAALRPPAARHDAARRGCPEYVLFGRHVPSSWIWRKLSRRPA